MALADERRGYRHFRRHSRAAYAAIRVCAAMNARKEPGTWADIQAKYADLPGIAGVEARRKHYAPFFLRMGRDVVIEEGCRFYHPDRIVLDDDARINIGALVYGSGGVWIGRHARIGPRFFV